MRFFALRPRELPYGLSCPVLAMELLHDRGDVRKILDAARNPKGDSRIIARQIYLDYFVILEYSLRFLLVGAILYYSNCHGFGIMVGLLVLSAAIFDMLENRAILHLMNDLGWPGRGPRMWSIIKWSLLFILLPVAARVYFTDRSSTFRKVVGLAGGSIAVVTGLLGLGGSFMEWTASLK